LSEHKDNAVFIWDNDSAGYDEMQYTIKLGFNWFNWKSIKPSERFEKPNQCTSVKIKDINDLVLYSDMIELDDEGFIKYDSLKNYIERVNIYKGETFLSNGKPKEVMVQVKSKASDIKTIVKYGKRDKLKKEKFKEVIKQQQLKKKNETQILNIEE
jgi:uncharacterized protein (UPF0335 family)